MMMLVVAMFVDVFLDRVAEFSVCGIARVDDGVDDVFGIFVGCWVLSIWSEAVVDADDDAV